MPPHPTADCFECRLVLFHWMAQKKPPFIMCHGTDDYAELRD